MIRNDRCYLRLLNFAKISRPGEQDPGEYTEIVALLGTCRPAELQACRAFLPLIYAATGRYSLRAQLPPAILQFLREQSLRLIAAEMGHRQWLLTHLDRFTERGIPVILLKGAAFAGTLYADNAPRLGVDLDLLVRKEDFDLACEVLGETMYPVVLAEDRAATHALLFERVFLAKGGLGPTVELHRQLTNPYIFTIDQSSLWAASRRHPRFNSELVRILSPEDSLLHLAVHAGRDLDFSTHNLLDAHEIWCQWQPDPEQLGQRAAAWGGRTVLWFLLTKGREIMATPVPERFLDSLRPGRIREVLNRRILSGLAAKGERRPAAPAFRCRQLLSQLTLPDHPGCGLRFQLFYARTRLEDWLLSRRERIR